MPKETATKEGDDSTLKAAAQPKKKKAPQMSSYEVGKKALDLRNAPAAIQAFTQCTIEFPDDSDCHWELGWSYFLNFEYGKAKSEWEIVEKLEPKREGLAKVLKRSQEHLNLQVKAWMLRSQSVASFNPRRKKSRETILLRAVGDTMLGTNYPKDMLPPDNSSPLSNVSAFFEDSDINFVNYEGTLCDQKQKSKCEFSGGTCFAFRAPTKFADWLKSANFNLVSLANNHTMDFGGACQEETEKTFDARKIPWSGRKDTVAQFEARGVPFSMIAFHSADHTNSTRDLKRVRELVQEEKSKKRLVIVSFHGGAEGFGALRTPKTKEVYFGEDRGDVRAFAKTAVDAGADLVIGHGPHVLRGMEFYKGKLIAYSLGNFATYEAFSLWGPNSVGAILEVELSKSGDFVSGRLIPTVQQGQGVPEFDPHSQALDLVRLLSKQDFGTNGVEVAQDGTIGKMSDAVRSQLALNRGVKPRLQVRSRPQATDRSPAAFEKPDLQ